jgi:hypothetical protein
VRPFILTYTLKKDRATRAGLNSEADAGLSSILPID